MCREWILYVREGKILKMPFTGSRRWRDLSWCSVICRNSFLAANQLFWSAELTRGSRLAADSGQAVRPAFQQWDVGHAMRGERGFGRRPRALPRADPSPAGAAAGPFSFCLNNVCRKEEMQMLFPVIYCACIAGRRGVGRSTSIFRQFV